MPKWEYLRYEYPAGEHFGRPDQEMSIIGSEGWELVSVLQVRTTFHYYFKRPIRQEEKS
jgi:hypothetical protein